MNVFEEIERVARAQPNALALVQGDPKRQERSLTYGQFLEQVERFSARLRQLQIAPGDRVIVFVPMQIELYVCMVALLRMGAVTVFIDPHMPRMVFDGCCKLIAPRAFIGIPLAHLMRLRSPALRRVPLHLTTSGLPRWIAQSIKSWRAETSPLIVPPVQGVKPSAPAMISYTTGSSGAPRGNVRSHEFVRAQLDALFQPVDKCRARVDIPGFPVLPLDNLFRGRTSILPQFPPGKVAQVEVKPLLAQVEKYQPDMMSGSPEYLTAIARHALRCATPLSSVRILFTGGAPISGTALGLLRQAWPNARVMVVYGSTEAEPVSRIDAQEIQENCFPKTLQGHGYCVGYPVDEVEVLVLPLSHCATHCKTQSDNLETLALPNFRIGQFVVRGAHVTTGYFNDRAGETQNKIHTREGIWHRMGDAGYRDKLGRLWLVGRTHTRLTSPWRDGASVNTNPSNTAPPLEQFEPTSSDWLFPYQVEAIINQQFGVRRAAYLQVDDAYHLVVEPLTKDPTKSAKKNWEKTLREAIEPFPISRLWVHSLPVDARHGSKVDYHAVQAMIRKGTR